MYLKGLLMNQNEITAQDRRTLHEWLIKICSAQSSQFASMHQVIQKHVTVCTNSQ